MSLIDIKSLKCPNCGAPCTPGQEVCDFCSMALPTSAGTEQLPEGPAADGSEDVIDYYALISLSPTESPSPLEIQQAALEAQERYLLNQYYSADERKLLIEQIEIGAWILTDSQARNEYDSILLALRNGLYNDKHLGILGELQQRARRELGLAVEEVSPQELLQQGAGYQALEMHREAVTVLKQAVEALPDSGEAHYRYARALLSAEDPLMMGGHNLRQAIKSFQTAAALDPTLSDASSYEALCRALLARHDGDTARAQAELQHTTRLNPSLGVAWRALAVLALQAGDHQNVLRYSRHALQCNAKDELTYLLVAASCWRAGQRDRARDAARRVATLRGSGWDAQRVLREIT